MIDDAQLLRRYAHEGSEECFAELVRRHVGWVYQAALRRTGGRHDLAQDVAQNTFTALAQHAKGLAGRDSLEGWLHVATRYGAARVRRAEARRLVRETAAYAMNETEQADDAAAWERLRPALDAALDRLSAEDRDALLRRFFTGLTFAQLGALAHIGEDGARKRVERALEKLRGQLARRGVTSTAAALGTLLEAHAAAPATAAVQAAVTQGALAGATSTAPALGLLHLMTATKTTTLATGLIGVAALCVIIATGVAVRDVRAAHVAEAEKVAMQRQFAAEQARWDELTRAARSASASTTQEPREATKPAVDTTTVPAAPAASPRRLTAEERRATERADAVAFLTAFPEVRQMLADQGTAQTGQSFALSFRITGLSPAEIAEVKARTQRQWLETLQITPDTIAPGEADPPEAQLREILSEEKFRKWQESNRPGEAQQWAKNLALAVNGTAEQPVTFEQVMRLAEIVAAHSPAYRAGKTVAIDKVDWATALDQAKPLLSEAQWQQAQPYLLKLEVERRARALRKEARQ